MMENKKDLVFAVDVDEVLRALVPGMIELYNKACSTNLKFEDVTEFKTEISFPLIEKMFNVPSSYFFFQKHGHDLFSNAPALPNIKEALDILRKQGKIVIVTYQKSLVNKIDCLEWLDKHQIYYDDICFLKDKTLLHADYLIDDNHWNFQGSYVTNGILINAPYNKNIDLKTLTGSSYCAKIERFDSLYDFAKTLEKD